MPSVCPRAGTTSRRRVLHFPPPRLPGADSAPWNKQSPTVTADTRHSPPGLPSDQRGLGSGSVVGSGVLPCKVLSNSYQFGLRTTPPLPTCTPLGKPCSGLIYTLLYIQQAHFTDEETDSGQETCYDRPAKRLSEHSA